MTIQRKYPNRLQFTLHSVFVTGTLLAVAMAIGCQWGGPAAAIVAMIFLSPFFAATYITVAMAAEWISELNSRRKEMVRNKQLPNGTQTIVREKRLASLRRPDARQAATLESLRH